MATKTVDRKYYLDWLRVLAILTIFIFHNGRFYDTMGWHVKNPTTYELMTVWTYLLACWIMPLIFLISGASLFHALGKGGALKFIKDKVLRLLVPLVISACTHVSIQVYLEYISQGRFVGSYLKFLPYYFKGLRGFGGNFAWMGLHLWYLEMLFIFSLAFLPLFLWLKTGSGRRLLGWLGDFLARPGAVFLLALPGTLLVSRLDPDSIFFGNRDWGGWALPMYVPYFLAGFMIISHDGLQESIRRQRWFSLAAGVIFFLALLVQDKMAGDPFYGTPLYALFYSLFSLMSWSLVLAFFGFARHSLKANTPFLRYANEAVLPFYVLHQTVIILIGYFVVRWHIPDPLKFVVIGLSSFGVIMGLYEFAIRRSNLLRLLFGMKPLVREPAAQPSIAVLVR